MKSINIVAIASLLTLVSATPVEKRALVVHTVVEEVVETVEATTTIWVKPTDGAHANYQLPETTSSARYHQHHHSHKPKPTTSTTLTSVAPVPVPTTPTTSSTSTSTFSTSSSTSISVPAYTPPVVSTPVYTPPVVSTPVYTPPVVSTPVYTPPVVSTPVYTPPVVATTPAPSPEPTTLVPAPSPTTSATSDGGSSGGACGTVGGSCSGDITYYEAGLGACGWTNDGSSEDVFALAHGMMGEQSNGNPFCGRMASIKVPGKPTVTAKLVDKCMGCEGESIDLSNHLFDQLCDEATGRLHNVEWHFTT